MSNIKTISIIISIIFLSLNLYSQTIPGTFSYQAVARDYQGFPIANQNIVVEISILRGTNCDDGNSCNNVWQELHYPTTNEFGLFTVEIGNGQSTYAGSETAFSNIAWDDVSSGNYFLKVRVDFGGALFGNGLIDMGITEFLTVPYSLASSDVIKINGKLPFALSDLSDVNISNLANNEVLKYDGSEWINGIGGSGGASALDDLDDVTFSFPIVANQTLLYNGSEWVNQTLNLNSLGGVSTGTPSLNQVLTFNGTYWTASDPVITSTLEDLTNVSINNVSDNQVLTYSGGTWINANAGSGSGLWSQSGSNIYYNSGNVGVGTSSPAATFHAETVGDNYFLVTGEYSTSISPSTVSAGSKMFFFPINSSFRAGYTNSTQWNSSNLGAYSAAFGYNNIANGSSSFASGAGNTAVGVQSFVSGLGNTAGGAKSFTVGSSNIAWGDNSAAFGENCITQAESNGSLSQGSFAAGKGSQTLGQYCSAWGNYSKARVFAMMAIGQFNLAGANSGNQNSWVGSDPVFVIGNGTSAALRNDALVVYQNGNATLAGTLTESSDKNLKENILDIENPLETINQLRGVTFSWKDDVPMSKEENNFHYGVIAQEIEEVIPSLVRTNENNIKSVAYTELIPILLEAIKEQQKQIEELKSENQSNSEKIDELMQKIERLEELIED